MGEQLLHNAYWAAKEYIINPLGQTEYNGVWNNIKYSIARWAVYDGTIEITEHGLKGVSEHNVIHQYFEDAFYNAMLGKSVTLSILSENGDFACNTGIIQDRAINTWSVASVELPSGTVASVYKWNGIRAGLLMVQITIAQGDVISKVKLEPGPISTLLNDPPPDYGLEMFKCMRYLRTGIAVGSLIIDNPANAIWTSNPIYLDPPMRVKPNITLSDLVLLLPTSQDNIPLENTTWTQWNATNKYFAPFFNIPDGVNISGSGVERVMFSYVADANL